MTGVGVADAEPEEVPAPLLSPTVSGRRYRCWYRRWYRPIRDLHLYAGLFLSPFVVVFALSVIFLNHGWLPWGGLQEATLDVRTVTIALPEREDDLELAREVRRRIGVSGEIGFIRRNVAQGRVTFPITTPGSTTNVRVDLASGEVRLARRETGPWDAMVYLHKMPGPHNVAIRGNWLFTRVWGWLADATVYLLLFLTVSGVYLWLTLRAERRAGLISLGAGVLSFVVLVLALVE